MIKEFLFQNMGEIEDTIDELTNKINTLNDSIEKDQLSLEQLMENIDYRIETFSPIFNRSPEIIQANSLKEKIADEQKLLLEYESRVEFWKNKLAEFQGILDYCEKQSIS